MNTKRVMSIMCGVLVVFFSSCTTAQEEPSSSPTSQPTNLVYYTIGEPDPGLKKVNQAINEVLKQKVNLTITYEKVGWQDYERRLNAMISSGFPVDILFAQNYASFASRKAWLCLDDYLQNEGKQMYETINPILWQGVRMSDGSIYGVPTNKELTVQLQWMYPKELVEKYQVDITQYQTVQSLEPLLQMISQNEPDYLPMELSKDSHNFFSIDGYEYLVDKKLPLMAKSLESHPKVVNIFETKECRDILYTLRDYYQKGYINEDAAIKESFNLTYGEKVFWKAAEGGPLTESSWSKDRGYSVVTQALSKPVVTTESTQGGVMAISAYTQYPSESVTFLNLLNTDPEVRNLFNYGIEGVQYTLDENGQVLLKDAQELGTNSYTGVPYTQGNWFILRTLGGKYTEPLDKWKQYQIYNEEAVCSSLLGFIPDLSGLSRQVANVGQVWDKYYPCLMTGSVDVDTQLPKFLKELQLSGIDAIKEELQSQLDRWILEKNQ